MDMSFVAVFAGIFFISAFVIVVILDIFKAKRHHQKYTVGRTLTALLLILPAALIAFFIVLLPILSSLAYSFTDYKIGEPISFVGFDNFKYIIDDLKNQGPLYNAAINTLLFVVIVVPLQIGVALGLALFCNVKMKGNAIFKVCFFIPVAVSLSVTSYLWLEILSGNEEGLLNSILGLFGVPAQKFLGDPYKTMFWFSILSAWQGCGFQMMIFLSALTGVRKELYEAARMDGCNAWQRFLRVTVPALKPTFVYVLVTVFIGASRLVIQPMLMTGPSNPAGMTISYYMLIQGQTYQDIGFSSAIAFIMTFIIGGITFIQRKFLGEKK